MSVFFRLLYFPSTNETLSHFGGMLIESSGLVILDGHGFFCLSSGRDDSDESLFNSDPKKTKTKLHLWYQVFGVSSH